MARVRRGRGDDARQAAVGSTGALALGLVDSKSWVEVHPAGKKLRVEYHCPQRESGIGWVDNPETRAVAPAALMDALAELLPTHASRDVVVSRLKASALLRGHDTVL